MGNLGLEIIGTGLGDRSVSVASPLPDNTASWPGL